MLYHVQEIIGRVGMEYFATEPEQCFVGLMWMPTHLRLKANNNNNNNEK